MTDSTRVAHILLAAIVAISALVLPARRQSWTISTNCWVPASKR
jgi:hypothetical protein